MFLVDPDSDVPVCVELRESPPSIARPPPVTKKSKAPDLFSLSAEIPEQPVHVSTASGEKSKARDILCAIRLIKQIERESRPSTAEECSVLARFAGFGPVALSIFPDPITGKFKDGWEAIGEELKTLLSPEEYASVKRTTFNAFYTSPTVISAMYRALARLGVPSDALVLEPGCGTGNFIAFAPKDMRFIGVELDGISGRIARARHPSHDIRIENFRDSILPQFDAVIGNCRPSGVMRSSSISKAKFSPPHD